MTDLLIIGAGPAGLSAAIYGRRAGLSVILLESSMYGGQMVTTPEVENYPAYARISGWELAQKLYEQAEGLGAEILFENVTAIEQGETCKRVMTDAGVHEAGAVIIANGAVRRKLDCPGEERLSGHGVSYCATCDGAFFRDKVTCVVGGGNSALEEALYLSAICKKVYLIHRRDAFRGDAHGVAALEKQNNVEYVLSHVPVEVLGEDRVTGIKVRNVSSGQERVIDCDGVFVAIGLKPDNLRFAPLLALDESGYLVAGEDCSTNIPGIYAAGDTRTKRLRQIITAASDGAMAATQAAAYLRG